jgi:hypothetical protein
MNTDRDLENILRSAMRDETERIEPADHLQDILRRTARPARARTSRRRRWVIGLAGAGLVAATVTSVVWVADQPGGDNSPSPPVASAPPPQNLLVYSYDTAPVVVHRSTMPLPTAIDLRVGEHRSFDRVVIDLRGEMSGYNVRFVKALVQDGSGLPVQLEGKHFVSVVLYPASAHGQAGNSLYHGPELEQYGYPALSGVAFISDYEGYVSFGISLSHQAPFRVNELTNPTRLVIDFKH